MQRTLAFSRFLPKYGWEPLVLSVHPRAYSDTGKDLLALLPQELKISRAQAWDTARHLAWRGRYADRMALPDRWISWLPGGVTSGLRLIRKYRPQAIWSTYPVATAHLIGWTLKKCTGIPWIADFRDPMVEKNPRTGAITPLDTSLRRARLFVERRCVEKADRLAFCTKGASSICQERYPTIAPEKSHVIPNGYDEESFQKAEEHIPSGKSGDRPVTLLHSGILYPTPDRDPSHFFAAVADLKKQGILVPEKVQFILRASGHDGHYAPIINKLGISDLVRLAPALPYEKALAEMLSADGLLLFQGYTSNPAIPAKLYEYLRAGKPVIAMADQDGETVALLKALGSRYIFSIEDADAIADGLSCFLSDLDKKKVTVPDKSAISRFDRRRETGLLANLLDGLK